MLIVGFKGIGSSFVANKYKDKIIEMYINPAINPSNSDMIVNFINHIKQNIIDYEVVIMNFCEPILNCLNALKIKYFLVYPDISAKNDFDKYWADWDIFDKFSAEKIKLQKGQYLEDLLALKFDWITNKELPAITDSNNNHELTFDDLVNKDVTITEADIRNLKGVENKLKVGMLLQAKTSLNRILKLSRTLDKLYDELVTRIDTDLTNTDTASLMYTADYISKALQDTNQFIVSLINNDKIKNFFIIDNSNIINVNDDENIAVGKRDKIRKAIQIVLSNIDKYEQGDLSNLINPNIEAEGEVINADNQS